MTTTMSTPTITTPMLSDSSPSTVDHSPRSLKSTSPQLQQQQPSKEVNSNLHVKPKVTFDTNMTCVPPSHASQPSRGNNNKDNHHTIGSSKSRLHDSLVDDHGHELGNRTKVVLVDVETMIQQHLLLLTRTSAIGTALEHKYQFCQLHLTHLVLADSALLQRALATNPNIESIVVKHCRFLETDASAVAVTDSNAASAAVSAVVVATGHSMGYDDEDDGVEHDDKPVQGVHDEQEGQQRQSQHQSWTFHQKLRELTWIDNRRLLPSGAPMAAREDISPTTAVNELDVSVATPASTAKGEPSTTITEDCAAADDYYGLELVPLDGWEHLDTPAEILLASQQIKVLEITTSQRKSLAHYADLATTSLHELESLAFTFMPEKTEKATPPVPTTGKEQLQQQHRMQCLGGGGIEESLSIDAEFSKILDSLPPLQSLTVCNIPFGPVSTHALVSSQQLHQRHLVSGPSLTSLVLLEGIYLSSLSFQLILSGCSSLVRFSHADNGAMLAVSHLQQLDWTCLKMEHLQLAFDLGEHHFSHQVHVLFQQLAKLRELKTLKIRIETGRALMIAAVPATATATAIGTATAPPTSDQSWQSRSGSSLFYSPRPPGSYDDDDDYEDSECGEEQSGTEAYSDAEDIHDEEEYDEDDYSNQDSQSQGGGYTTAEEGESSTTSSSSMSFTAESEHDDANWANLVVEDWGTYLSQCKKIKEIEILQFELPDLVRQEVLDKSRKMWPSTTKISFLQSPSHLV